MAELDFTAEQKAQQARFDEEYAGRESHFDFDHYEKPRFGPWNPYWYVHNFVRRRAVRPGLRLLNLGCGTGADALRYARMGYCVEGIDISRRGIDIARSRASEHGLAERARFSLQPAECLEFPDEYFDLVVGVDVLHHVDVSPAAREIGRVLKPGGTAVFREPLSTPWRDGIRNSKAVTWLLPRGVKSIPKGLTYTDSEGEHKLDQKDFDLLRQHAGPLAIHRWRVLGLLSVLVANRNFLERCDWLLFKIFPFVRRLGDQAVLVVEKAR